MVLDEGDVAQGRQFSIFQWPRTQPASWSERA